MPSYICPRCSKKFDRISNYKRHINRITPCTDLNEEAISDVKNDVLENSMNRGIEVTQRSQDLVNPKFPGKIGINSLKNPEKLKKIEKNTKIRVFQKPQKTSKIDVFLGSPKTRNSTEIRSKFTFFDQKLGFSGTSKLSFGGGHFALNHMLYN